MANSGISKGGCGATLASIDASITLWTQESAMSPARVGERDVTACPFRKLMYALAPG